MRYPLIEVEGIGPVLKASIELRPLTVFIGPNNVGKSYVSIVIHALKNAILEGTRQFYSSFLRKMYKKPSFSFRMINKEMEKYLINEKAQNRLWKLCAVNLKNQLEHNFSATIDEIINVNSDKLHISIKQRFFEGYINIYKNDTIESKCKVFLTKNQKKVRIDRFLLKPIPSFFLPAARSGILQAHKTIAAVITSLSSLMPVRDITIPRISGVSASFVARLLTIGEHPVLLSYFLGKTRHLFKEGAKKQIDDILNFIEESILKGSIELEAPFEKLAPDIYYRSGEMSIPIHRASSMVSEIAPIYLYIKYVLRGPSFLIIEEPESHLHPEAQTFMARLLVKLVRSGIHILITTHSDYLLSQLNNHILLSYLTPETYKNIGYSETEYLKPEEIGVYLFKFKNEDAVVEKILVTKDGITDKEFGRIAEEIYDTYTKLYYYRKLKV